jgi:hypothetical protein
MFNYDYSVPACLVFQAVIPITGHYCLDIYAHGHLTTTPSGYAVQLLAFKLVDGAVSTVHNHGNHF